MTEHALIQWLVLMTVIVAIFRAKWIADLFRYFGDGGRGSGPSHPLPVTGKVETSRGAANPKDSKPVGRRIGNFYPKK